MIISIVGKSGSGKSTIAKTLESLDERLLHVDIDQISHQVLTFPEVQEALKNTFGTDVVMDGEVQRKVLGQIVFTTPEQMQKLTNITWHHMEQIIDSIIKNNPNKVILLDYILLPKTKYFNESDLKIWVDAPYEVRVERVINRAIQERNVTREYFKKRDEAGINYEEGKYDIVINNINKEQTQEEVKKVYEKSILRR